VKVFSETDFEKAVAFAKENKQIAIFNISKKQEVEIETEGL